MHSHQGGHENRAVVLKRSGKIEIVPIHFDVPGHQLPLATFVRTSVETEGVVRGLNEALFGGRLRFEIIVLPPEEGSFLTRLGMVLLGGWGLIWAFTESDVGKGFVKGLTDHEPAYWAESIGKTAKLELNGKLHTSGEPGTDPHAFETKILSKATIGFLEKSNLELTQVGLRHDQFLTAFAAKDSFFRACQATTQLTGLGFSSRPEFPIKRDDFDRFQISVAPDGEGPEPPWYVGTAVLRVTSPNWDRQDRTRQWKGRDKQGRERYFRIEDAEFWKRVLAGQISDRITSIMKVQWAFQGTAGHPRNCRVLRVLKYDDRRLARPLSPEELLSGLTPLEGESQKQRDLFWDYDAHARDSDSNESLT